MHINVKLNYYVVYLKLLKCMSIILLSLCIYVNYIYIYKYIFILDRAKMKYSTK